MAEQYQGRSYKPTADCFFDGKAREARGEKSKWIMRGAERGLEEWCIMCVEKVRDWFDMAFQERMEWASTEPKRRVRDIAPMPRCHGRPGKECYDCILSFSIEKYTGYEDRMETEGLDKVMARLVRAETADKLEAFGVYCILNQQVPEGTTDKDRGKYGVLHGLPVDNSRLPYNIDEDGHAVYSDDE